MATEKAEPAKDLRLTKLFKRQHGLVTTSQATALGIRYDTLSARCRAGSLVRVSPGIYRLAASPVTQEQRLLAALLSHPSGAVASHRAAAWLHGFDDCPFFIEVRARSVAGTRPYPVHEAHDVFADTTTVSGIRCTTAARTLLDLAALFDARRLEIALLSAVRLGRVSYSQLERHLQRRGRGRLGAPLLRRLIAASANQEPTDSALATALIQMLRDAGLPLPVREYRVGPYILDAAYPDTKVALEADGLAAHGSAPALVHDLRRQNYLLLAGWRPFRFTHWDMAAGEAAGRSLVTVCLALGLNPADYGLGDNSSCRRRPAHAARPADVGDRAD